MRPDQVLRNPRGVLDLLSQHLPYGRIKEAVINEETLTPTEVRHLARCSDCLESIREAVRERLRDILE